MKVYKLILKPIKEDNDWGYEDKDAIKTGEVVYEFKGKIEDEEVNFKKGTEIAYQYGNPIKIDNKELILVNLGNVIWQK